MFYRLYSLLTAPGVVVHELAHTFFCWIGGVKIHKIRLFQFGKTAGYVIHDDPNNIIQSIFISFGPLVINSLLAMFLFTKFSPPYWWLPALYLYLGIAIALHSIPSFGDAKSLLDSTNYKIWRNPLKILAYPFVLVLYILNLFKTVHLDFIYVIVLYWLANFYLKS